MGNARTAYTKVAAPRRIETVYPLRWDMFLYLVVVMMLFTVVSSFHVWSRVKVVDLNFQIVDVSRQMKEEQQNFNRLRLEVASLKTPARIEALARGELGMALPNDQQVVLVR
ncbi:MAG: cell division protein FtsL [Geobacteraceae bacterium]